MPPVSPDYVAHILDLLSGWGGVSARRMFSGVGLFRGGLMFGLIVRDVLYLKADDRNRPEFEAAGLRPFSYSRPGRTVELPYWEAPPELFDDAEEMLRWARRSFDAALAIRAERDQRAKAKKPARRPARRAKRARKITKI